MAQSRFDVLEVDPPSPEQLAAYRAMFRHFNRALFAGELAEPMLNLSRSSSQRSVAFFIPNGWRDGRGQLAHEISLSPRYLAEGSALTTAQSLVHEMVHLWQFEHGTPPRRGYHDREWGQRMVELGLQPINAKTGKPCTSAQSCDDQVIDGGRFARAFEQLPPDALLPWSSVEAAVARVVGGGDLEAGDVEGDEDGAGGAGDEQPVKPKNKVKYTCPSCLANAWGKPELHIICGVCREPFAIAS